MTEKDYLEEEEEEIFSEMIIREDGKIEYVDYDNKKEKTYKINITDLLDFLSSRSSHDPEHSLRGLVMYLRRTGIVDKDVCPYSIGYISEEDGYTCLDYGFCEKYKDSINIYKGAYGDFSAVFYKPGLTESVWLLRVLLSKLSALDEEKKEKIEEDLLNDLEFGYVDEYSSPLKIHGIKIDYGPILGGRYIRDITLYIKPKNGERDTEINIYDKGIVDTDEFLIYTENHDDITTTAEFLRNVDYVVGYLYGLFKKHGSEIKLPELYFV